MPAYDDATQFEFLVLESAQAGLSWSTVLHKRDGYRQAFAGFDPVQVACFSAQKIDQLIANPKIIRNRLKIRSAVTNAQAFLAVQQEFGSFSAYIWGFVEGQPVLNHWRRQQDIPVTHPNF